MTELGLAKNEIAEILVKECYPIRAPPYRIAPGMVKQLREDVRFYLMNTHTRAESNTSISEFNTIHNKNLISTSHKSRHLTISYTARISQSLAKLL